MLISALTDDKKLCVRLHAEQAYSEIDIKQLDELKLLDEQLYFTKGYYTKKITYSVLDKLLNYFEKLESEINTICLDFSNLHEVQDNMSTYWYKMFMKLKQKGLDIILINISTRMYGNLFSCLLDLIETDCKIYQSSDLEDKLSKVIISDGTVDITYNYSKQTEELYDKKLKENLQQCTKDNSKNLQHSSSPVYLSKYIDIKEFIRNKNFFLLSVYVLVHRMIKSKKVSGEYNENRNKILFFHTLNGANIASMIAMLLGIDVLFLDHIGPINKVYKNSFEYSIQKEKEYIIVSDVVCLRTELRIAKNLIEFLGGRYSGHVSIVEVETIKNDEVYKLGTPLFFLRKEDNIIDYSIKTEF